MNGSHDFTFLKIRLLTILEESSKLNYRKHMPHGLPSQGTFFAWFLKWILVQESFNAAKPVSVFSLSLCWFPVLLFVHGLCTLLVVTLIGFTFWLSGSLWRWTQFWSLFRSFLSICPSVPSNQVKPCSFLGKENLESWSSQSLWFHIYFWPMVGIVGLKLQILSMPEYPDLRKASTPVCETISYNWRLLANKIINSLK